MPAGDEEDRVGPFTGEAALQIRRRMFLDAIQDVDQETGELVATETARNDLILPDTGENNQFIRRKFQSLNPFSGENTPDFRRRKIICQRSGLYLDPINKYYAMGQDRELTNRVTFTPIASDEEFYGQFGREGTNALMQGYRLTPEAPSSINVNFSFAGYREASDNQVTNDRPQLSVRGVNDADKRRIQKAIRNEVHFRQGGRIPGFVYPGQSREFPHGRDANFNFYREMIQLAEGGITQIFETLNEALQFFPQTNTYEGGALTKTIGGTPRNQVAGGRGYWQPSARMNRILRTLGYDDYDDFQDDYSIFELEQIGGQAIYLDFEVPPNRRRNVGASYEGYNNSLNAVLQEIATTRGVMTALRCARAAMTRQERIERTLGQTPQVFEFYDFQTETSFIEDPFTKVLTENNTTRDQLGAATIPAATIQATYNYTLDGYESAIASSNIPEPALPNLYVYQLAASSPSADELTGPGWDSSPEGDEIRRGYDRLVRLGEFVQGTLPSLMEESDRPNGPFREYLRQYGEQTRNVEVTVDFTSEIARRYQNIATDATSMMLYNQFNGYKRDFPMYIELGIPMTVTGTINTLLLKDLSTRSMVNSIKNVEPSGTVPFKIQTYGAIAPAGTTVLGPSVFDQRQRDIAIAELKTPLKVYDFNRWLTNTRQALNDDEAEITFNGPGADDPNVGDAFARVIRREVNNKADNVLVTYKDFLEGKKTFCESETVLFKLIKYRSNPIDPMQRTIVQTYYFPNTDGTENRPLTSDAFQQSGLEEGPQDIEYKIINFVDTQVKYNQNYQYELHAVDIVYGSKFSFRTRAAIFPENENAIILSEERNLNQDEFTGGSLVFFSFNVDTTRNVKVVEYPVSSFRFRPVDNAGDTRPLPLSRKRPDLTIGGLAYPVVKCVDLPPVRPEVSIFPYKRQNKILVNVAPGVGEYKEDNALNFIAFDQAERDELEELNALQQSNNITFSDRKLSYREVDGPVKVLVYRTTTMETNVDLPSALYQNFSGKLYKTLDVSSQASPENKARAYDLIDELEPNVKYYYTFRVLNLKNMISNPTPIYEVELKDDEGFFSPFIKEFSPMVSTAKKESKSMARFLEIKASDLQSEPFTEFNEVSGYNDPRTGQFVARKSLIPQTGENGIAGNKFLVRLTSKDTGRKVNIVIDFDISENR